MGKKGGGFGTTLFLALVIVLLSVALGVGISRFDFMEHIPVVGPFLFEEQSPRTTTGPVVVEAIQDLDQLATVRWEESVIIARKSGGTELERILSGEEVTVIAAGYVEAGVNLADLNRDDVRVNGETVTIRLPEPEILSVSLDEDETRVYDQDFGLLKFDPTTIWRRKPAMRTSLTRPSRTPRTASAPSSPHWASKRSASRK